MHRYEDDVRRVLLLRDQRGDVSAKLRGQLLEAGQALIARQDWDLGAVEQQERLHEVWPDGETTEEAAGGGTEPEDRIPVGALHDCSPRAE